MPTSFVAELRRRLLLPSALASACAVAAAQSGLIQVPTGDATFVTRQWHSSNGLPQNTVNAILQTRDRMLWIATLGGVCAFDGERMLVFDPVTAPALRSSRFNCLCESADGTLWIGSDTGGLFRHRDGVFAHVPEVDEPIVTSVAEGADGTLFVTTENGLFVRRGGTFVREVDPRIAGVRMVQRGSSGAVYLADEKQLFRHGADGLARVAPGSARCVLELGERLLVGNQDGLFRVQDGALIPWSPAPGITPPVLSMTLARDGAVWIGSWTYAYRIAPSSLAFEQTSALTMLAPLVPPLDTQATRSLCEDHEGGMWIGLTERGLLRLAPAEVRAYGLRDGLPRRNLSAVGSDGRGGILVSAMEGLFRLVGNRFERVPELDSMLPLRTFHVDADGTQWIASEQGLVRRDDAGCVLAVPSTTWPAHRVVAMQRGPDGGLWLGGEGLARYAAEGLTVPPVAAALRSRSIRSLAFAPDDALWLGCTDGLVRADLRTGAIREWRSGKDLPYGQVRSVLAETGERAWIATYGGGVVRIDGDRCTSVDERHGMHDQHLCAMTVQGDDFVLSSNRGLSVVPRAAMEAVAHGVSKNLISRQLGTPGDGPAEMNGRYQGNVANVGGKVWVVGIEAVFEFDPSQLAPSPHDLPVHVQDLFAGDQRLPATADVTPPAGQRTFALRLGTCAFGGAEKVRFRWRLLGVRDEWSSPTLDHDVRLVGLPPGDHVFEASTVGADGTSSREVLRLNLHLARLWWEESWIRGVGLFGLAAFAFLLVRFGASRTAARAARFEALVEERTRELVAAQQHLEQRVADRTTELSEALHRQELAQDEQQRLERELQRMQRMDSIGQLAGGVAHDFNNLLTVVHGASELLVDEDRPTERAELCRAIAQASQRGRNLTQHLLAVASRQHVVTERLELGKVVKDLQPVLKPLLGDAIALRIEVDGEFPVRAAVTQIEQVLLNLSANSRDAMPRGGELKLSVTATDDSVCLRVRDTGVGMTPEVVERAFEPFFSTKGRGGTRGLGLATVYGIVKQLNGRARIDSSPGAGTTVTIELPRDASMPGAAATLVPHVSSTRVDARVLLIEDEDAVRVTVQRLLTRFGCSVRATADGDAALAMLRAEPDAFDVVLSDVVMPGLHGRELLEALRAVRADVPIVFVSGYLDGRLTHRDLADAGLEILAKPIDREQLAAALLRAMARPEASRVESRGD